MAEKRMVEFGTGNWGVLIGVGTSLFVFYWRNSKAE